MKKYIYVTSKFDPNQISANGDMLVGLSAEQFVGKPVSLNFDHVVGEVIDAKKNEVDQTIELTMKVDKKINLGGPGDVSISSNVSNSVKNSLAP